MRLDECYAWGTRRDKSPSIRQSQPGELALDEVEVPDFDQGIGLRSAGQSAALMVEGQTGDHATVAGEGEPRLSGGGCGDVPDPDRALLRAHREVTAVRREGQGEHEPLGLV